MLRPVLSLLVVAALAGAALAVPAIARADTTGTIVVTDSMVHFDPAGQSGTAEVAYSCYDPDAVVEEVELDTEILQPASASGGVVVAYPEKQPHVTCDGSPHAMTVTYTRKYVGDDAPAVTNGAARVGLYVGSGAPGDLGPIVQDVTVSGIVPDPRASVKITLNAHPEPTREGSKTTVQGKITRAGRVYAKKKASLFFTPDGSDTGTLIKTVTATRKGALKTTVKATASGTYRFDSAGTTKTQPGRSRGDDVEVVPALRTFANCTELNEVYPHGVGKKGAVDHTSGTQVTDFVVDDAQYATNKKSDRDQDGIACEKR